MNLEIGFEQITMFLSPVLLLCDGPVHVARLGDDFVAKIADQSGQVLGEALHGGVLDVIVIVDVFLLPLGSILPRLIVVRFQLLMAFGWPRGVHVLLK